MLHFLWVSITSLILAEMSRSVKRFLSDLIQTYVDVKQLGHTPQDHAVIMMVSSRSTRAIPN